VGHRVQRPERLARFWILRLSIVLFAPGNVVHRAVADWSKDLADLLLVILAAGIMLRRDRTITVTSTEVQTRLRGSWHGIVKCRWWGFL